MTIAVNTRKSGPYTASAGQTVFNYTFPLEDAADIKVTRNRGGIVTTLSASDFVVTGVGTNGGTFVLNAGAQDGDVYVALGSLPIERDADFSGFKSIPNNAINLELDRMIIALQEMRRDIDGAIALHPVVAGDAYDLLGNRLINVGEPLEGADAVTRDYGDAHYGGAAANNAAESATSAATSEANISGVLAQVETARDTAVAASIAAQAVVIMPPQGRLTLADGVSLSASDIAGATSVYFARAGGQSIPVYNGTSFVMVSPGSDLSLLLDATTGHSQAHNASNNFDVFYVNVGGTFYFGTGPAWSSATSRGTGAGTSELENFGSFLVNKNIMILRYGANSGDVISVPARQATFLGSFRTTANGQTEDSVVKRFLSNAYNPFERTLTRSDTGTWTYSTNAYRQANGNAANQVEWLHCLSGRPVSLEAISTIINSTTTTRNCFTQIGLDGVSPVANLQVTGKATADILVPSEAKWKGLPGLGYHKALWLECGAGTDTQTWIGSNTGLLGSTWN